VSTVNGSVASPFASPPVVSTVPLNVQSSSIPTPRAVTANPSRSAAVTSQRPWNGSYSAANEEGLGSAPADGAFSASLTVSFVCGPSLPGGPPAPFAGPVSGSPATAPTANTTVPTRAPALSFVMNMAVSTPSQRTTAETDAELT
jgi:hypothetical protein